MYAVGMAAAKDETDAVKWYRKEAERGNGRAQLILGEHYYHGNGVSQDYAEAVKWFRKATEHGNAASQDMYARGAARHAGAATGMNLSP